MNDFVEINKAINETWGGDYSPSRTTFGVNDLPRKCRVVINAIAFKE
jgi:hypothetical protein